MAFPYAALPPTCYTPPSLSGFKPCGRDKLGMQEVFQQPPQLALRSCLPLIRRTEVLIVPLAHIRLLLPRRHSCR